MGARNSKRSVDISGAGRETEDDPQPLDGKLEKIEEGAKVAVNGASHSEPKIAHDEQVSNGDPVSAPEPVAVAEVAGPSSPTEEAQEETTDAELVQPPKKKEKVKKKWSLRSISFSRKDKSKPSKDDSTKEDADTVPAVAEEKSEDAPGFMSSVTGALEGAAEAVGEAVVSAEHKVEEGLTATQDQVEKISAKVAEKAEALVVKMEAMTVKAVDSVQEMIGLGEAHKAEVDKVEEALTDAAKIPVVVPEVVNLEGTTAKVTMPETANTLEAKFAEVEAALDETMTKAEAIASEASKNITKIKEDVKTDVDSLTSNIAEVVTNVTVSDLVPGAESETSVAVEMPPPLPASPPPTTAIADKAAQVVDTAAQLATQVVTSGQLAETRGQPMGGACIAAATNLLYQDTSAHSGGEGGGDHPPPLAASEELLPSSQPLETLVNNVTPSVRPEQLENEIDELEGETEQEPLDESAPKNANETRIGTEDTTGTAAVKGAEE